MIHKNNRHNNGFTLIELLVAMVMAIFLSFAMTKLFLNNKSIFVSQSSSSKIQNDSDFILFLMSNDISLAGHRGCSSGPISSSNGTQFYNVSGNASYYNSTLFIQGSKGTGTAFSPGLHASVSSLNPAPSNKMDVLTIRSASLNPVFLTTTMTNVTSDLVVSSLAELKANSYGIISNCFVSSLFRVNTASDLTIKPVVSLNSKYNSGDQIYSYNTTVYYVGSNNILYKSVNGGASEIIAYNVEQFSIMYGVDTNNTLNTGQYVFAPGVADFNKVVSLKIGLVVKSDNINTTGTGKSNYTYDFNGVTYTPKDSKLRKIYYKTITLRNMLP